MEYFCKLPQDIAARDVLVLDPMLATGGSAIDAITQIKKHGAKRIKMCIRDRNAVNKVLDKGLRTADNMSEGCTCLGCTAMGDAILAEI